MTHIDTLQQPILLPGGGLVWNGSDKRLELTERTYHRLVAVLPRALKLASGAFVLCSGGFSRMDAEECVPKTQREGHQMASWLMSKGVPSKHIEVDVTPEDTIGNLVSAVQGGWIDLRNPQPLPVATHSWHLPRLKTISEVLGIGRVDLINAGDKGASSYEPISLEAHRKVLGGVGCRALLNDPVRYQKSVGKYIELNRTDNVQAERGVA